MLFRQPRTDMPIAREPGRGLQLGFECGEGGVREAARPRRLGDGVLESLFQPSSCIRRKPRRHAMPVDMQQRGHLLAVPGLAARDQIQGM
jgi:hypothetical protein